MWFFCDDCLRLTDRHQLPRRCRISLSTRSSPSSHSQEYAQSPNLPESLPALSPARHKMEPPFHWAKTKMMELPCFAVIPPLRVRTPVISSANTPPPPARSQRTTTQVFVPIRRSPLASSCSTRRRNALPQPPAPPKEVPVRDSSLYRLSSYPSIVGHFFNF